MYRELHIDIIIDFDVNEKYKVGFLVEQIGGLG
jgi:hypothetical protein